MAAQEISPAGQREGGLDSLRGLMLVGMGVNHITSHLQVLTDHPFGYTSSAEGFVFLSGLVAGLVYTRRRQRNGPAAAAQASRRRVCTLYLCHLALFTVVWWWVNFYFTATGNAAGNTPPVMLDHPGLSLVSGALLISQPPLLDILPMYAGFMLLLPLVLTALEAGHRGRVLIVSFTGWLLTNLLWPDVAVKMGVAQTGAFNFGAWQLLFFVGVICGHAQATGAKLLPKPKAWVVIPAVALCAWCFLIRHWYWPAPFATFADWVNKNNLAPVRLLNTGALFLLVHFAFRRWPQAFNWRPFALLGRHSLAVFATHIIVAYVLFAFPEYVSTTSLQTWIGTTIMLSALFITAWWQEAAGRQSAAARLQPRRALARARERVGS